MDFKKWAEENPKWAKIAKAAIYIIIGASILAGVLLPQSCGVVHQTKVTMLDSNGDTTGFSIIEKGDMRIWRYE